MSDDDLIRRRDVSAMMSGLRMGPCDPTECGGSCVACRVDRAIRALPSASPSAERLARAVDEMEDECCGAGIPQYLAANGWKDSEAAFIRMLSALSAFRAAPEPAPTKEPAKPEPCRTCQGHLTVSDCITHTDYDHDTGESREWGEMVSRPCPDCRPGGDA